MGEMLSSKETVVKSQKLLLVPKKEYFFPEDFIVGLRKRLGIPYGDGAKKADCVTFPLRELNKISRKVAGGGIDRETFANGGRLIEIYSKNGGSVSLISPDELKNLGTMKPGNLILAVEPAKNADALRKHFDAGDYAIWQDGEGKCSVVKNRKDAEAKLKGSGEKLFLTKHYLTFADNTQGKETVIHASKTRNKAVEQKLSDYLGERIAKRRLYLVVDLEVAYPALASREKKAGAPNEFLAAAPQEKKSI